MITFDAMQTKSGRTAKRYAKHRMITVVYANKPGGCVNDMRMWAAPYEDPLGMASQARRKIEATGGIYFGLIENGVVIDIRKGADGIDRDEMRHSGGLTWSHRAVTDLVAG